MNDKIEALAKKIGEIVVKLPYYRDQKIVWVTKLWHREAIATYITENYIPRPESTNKEFNPQGIDAVVWAKEFMRLYNKSVVEQKHLWIDEALMLGWFANAIMAGADEKERRMEKSHIRKDEVELEK